MVSAFSSTSPNPHLCTAPTLLAASLDILRQPSPLTRVDLYRALGYADDAYDLAVEDQRQQQPSPHTTATAGRTGREAQQQQQQQPGITTTSTTILTHEEDDDLRRPPHLVVTDPRVPLLRRCEALQSLCLGRLRRELGGADEAHERRVYARGAACGPGSFGVAGRDSEKEEAAAAAVDSKKRKQKQQQQQQQRRCRLQNQEQDPTDCTVACPVGSTGGSPHVAPKRPSTVRFVDPPTATEEAQGRAIAGNGVVGIRDVHGNLVAYKRKPQLRPKARQSFDGWRNVV